ncbi:MAG TPA: helix-hairpin-helix domain-containing protein [Candidatus Acidoferrales bacterium]|nr:helix-hairpin-helix domain-containing protein [Candidatus Acidoferrales bacterium]
MHSHECRDRTRRLLPLQLALILCVTLLLAIPLSAAPKKKLPAHPIDLNAATLQQLEELPGVGPVTAEKILDFRKKSGAFKSVNDLLAVPRISKARFAKIKPYVYVTPPAANPKH